MQDRRSLFIPQLPYEDFLRKICGGNWRTGSEIDRQGAIGIAICKSVLAGLHPDTRSLSAHLKLEPALLEQPLRRLHYNGVFLRYNWKRDEEDMYMGDQLTWLYIAGKAAGLIGSFID